MQRRITDPVDVSATILAGPFDLVRWFGPREDDQLRLTVEAVMRRLLDCRLWLVPTHVAWMGQLTIGTVCTNCLPFTSALTILSRLHQIEGAMIPATDLPLLKATEILVDGTVAGFKIHERIGETALVPDALHRLYMNVGIATLEQELFGEPSS